MVGSATCMFHWLGEATTFVREHAAVLATKPVWLFSSAGGQERLVHPGVSVAGVDSHIH